jgi:ABC-type branched-subunit amino acid transport system substrate-binding protein
MIRRRTLASLMAVGAVAVAAIVAGCADADHGGRGVVGDLKVGVLAPLTGRLSQSGRAGAAAADLAASRVNAAAEEAGILLSLSLVEEDTRSDPRAAQEAASTLIEGQGVSAIVGPWAGELAPTAEHVTVAAGVPMVSPSSTSPAVSGLDDDGLVFRTAPSDALQGQVLAQLVADALGEDASVVTAHRDDSYGAAVVEQFTRAFVAGGGTVVRNVPYDPAAARLGPAVREIVRGRPDGWLIIDVPDSWVRMGPALARTRRWDPARTFTGSGLRAADLPDRVGRRSTEGMRGSVPTTLGAPAASAFDALWRREVGEPRRAYDAQTFDAVVLIALAAVAAGSSDPAAIAASLQRVSGPPGRRYTFRRLADALQAAAGGEEIDYEGASGPIDLNSIGDTSSARYRTWSYRDGALVDGGPVIPFTAE